MNGKKTYLVSIGTVLTAIGGYLTGNIELAEALNLAIGAILAATLRHGIAKK